MTCVRCGSTENIEKHHIVHQIKGGTDDKENLEELCRHCHRYQHVKERIIGKIERYLQDLRRITKEKEKDYALRHIDIELHRLTVVERENTPLFIISRGYYTYWNDKTTHQGGGFKFK